MSAYDRRVLYVFEVLDQMFATAGIETCECETYVEVEEMRKNGQEDTHMSGVFVLTDGTWVWDRDPDFNSFDEYWGPDLGPAIEEYLNTNPPPVAGD